MKSISYSKTFAGGFKPFTFVQTSYLNMCKLESLQKDEGKA